MRKIVTCDAVYQGSPNDAEMPASTTDALWVRVPLTVGGMTRGELLVATWDALTAQVKAGLVPDGWRSSELYEATQELCRFDGERAFDEAMEGDVVELRYTRREETQAEAREAMGAMAQRFGGESTPLASRSAVQRAREAGERGAPGHRRAMEALHSYACNAAQEAEVGSPEHGKACELYHLVAAARAEVAALEEVIRQGERAAQYAVNLLRFPGSKERP